MGWTLSSDNYHEFIFFIFLVTTIGQLLDSMELRLDVRIVAHRQGRFPRKRWEVYTEHFVALIILLRTVCQVMLSGHHPSLTFRAFALLKMKQCAFLKIVHTSRSMSYTTLEMTSTFSRCTRTLSLPSERPTSSSSICPSSEMNSCYDPQQVSECRSYD